MKKTTKCPVCQLDLEVELIQDKSVYNFTCPRCGTDILYSNGNTEIYRGKKSNIKECSKRRRYAWVWLIFASSVIIFILSMTPSQESVSNNTKTISLDSIRYEEHQRLQRSIRMFPTLSDVVAREISGSTEGSTSFQLDQIWKNEFEGKGAWGVGTVVDVRQGLVGGHVVRVMCGNEKIELLPRNDQNGQMLLNLNRGQEFRFRGLFYRRGSLVKVVLSEAYLDE